MLVKGMDYADKVVEGRDIVEARGGKRGGCFDVMAWRGADELVFAEYKSLGDRPNANEEAWIEAALATGVSEEQLVVVSHPDNPV